MHNRNRWCADTALPDYTTQIKTSFSASPPSTRTALSKEQLRASSAPSGRSPRGLLRRNDTVRRRVLFSEEACCDDKYGGGRCDTLGILGSIRRSCCDFAYLWRRNGEKRNDYVRKKRKERLKQSIWERSAKSIKWQEAVGRFLENGEAVAEGEMKSSTFGLLDSATEEVHGDDDVSWMQKAKR